MGSFASHPPLPPIKLLPPPYCPPPARLASQLPHRLLHLRAAGHLHPAAMERAHHGEGVLRRAAAGAALQRFRGPQLHECVCLHLQHCVRRGGGGGGAPRGAGGCGLDLGLDLAAGCVLLCILIIFAGCSSGIFPGTLLVSRSLGNSWVLPYYPNNVVIVFTVLILLPYYYYYYRTFGKLKSMVFTSKKVSLRVKNNVYSAMVSPSSSLYF